MTPNQSHYQFDGSTKVNPLWEAVAGLVYYVLMAVYAMAKFGVHSYRYLRSRSPIELFVLLWLGSAAVITATGLVLILVDYNQ